MNSKILHISTGGTIEGIVPEYKEIGTLASEFSDVVHIAKYIQKSNIHASYSFTQVCSKDSREIDEQDRTVILEKIVEFYEKDFRCFLMTHSTYTMPETGIFLIENLPKEIVKECNIVLTGAMYPMNIIGSDALLNIGASLSSLLNIKDLGVKICMHGINWDPYKVKKDTENLIFTDKVICV